MQQRNFVFIWAILCQTVVTQPQNNRYRSIDKQIQSMQLFPAATQRGPERVQPQLTTKLIQLLAQSSTTVDSNDPEDPKELTISMPRFHKDKQGNWVYFYWGATYGKVWRDTRFNINGKFTIQRLRVDSSAAFDYYPGKPLPTVCLGKSSIYNMPKVRKYLVRNVYKEVHRHRPIWTNLRRQIYILGAADECHRPKKYKKWEDFQNCQIKRNMRLEYLIPQYPLHQLSNE